MIRRRQLAIRLLIPIVVLSVSQIYVSADATFQDAKNQGVRTPAVPMVGRLEVHRGRTIRVDDNDAEDGHTILDGQVLETSDCVSATVHLLPVGFVSPNPKANPALIELGQIDLATNTKAIINYSAGTVKVTLVRGCARERMSSMIDATIIMPDGSSVAATLPDTFSRKRAEVCYPSNKREDFTPFCPAPIVWIGGGGGAAVATVVAAIALRGENPSPESPSR
jgi:hypothetical protein